MLTQFLLVLLVLAVAGWILAPFPHWPSYFALWRSVLRGAAPLGMRARQAWFLLKVGAVAPLRTFLWYLDELLYPDYRARAVRPVFIIGQPRCGTTLLHRTMAEDTRTFFAVRHYEWRYPFIALQKAIRLLGLERWLGRRSYWPRSPEGRLAARMHANLLSDWEEDGILFEEAFLHHFFIFLRFPDPQLLPHVDGFTALPPRTRKHFLDIHQRVIQKVQYLRGPEPRIFLSKEVTSHDKLPSLLEKYPDGQYIVITRKANSFMASLQGLMQASTLVKTSVNPITIAGWRDAFVDRMREDSRRLVDLCRHTIPASNQLLVPSDHFVREVASTVRGLYGRLALPMSPEFAAHLDRTQEASLQRDRGYNYDEVSVDGFEYYDSFVDEITTRSRAIGPDTT